GHPTVDRTVLAELTRRASSLRGLTNCFSGQGVYLISGTRRNVVRSYIPVVGSIDQPADVIGAGYRRDPRAAGPIFQLVADQQGGRVGFGGGEGGYGGRGVGYQP